MLTCRPRFAALLVVLAALAFARRRSAGQPRHGRAPGRSAGARALQRHRRRGEGRRRRAPSSVSSAAPACRPTASPAQPHARHSAATAGTPWAAGRLSAGAAGWDVAALQFLLAWHGFPSATFDGGLGSHTERALRHFQRWAGLSPTAWRAPRRSRPSDAARHVPDRARLAAQRPVGDRFGPRGDRFHAGLDILAARGTPIARRRAGPCEFRRLRRGRLGEAGHGHDARQRPDALRAPLARSASAEGSRCRPARASASSGRRATPPARTSTSRSGSAARPSTRSSALP